MNVVAEESKVLVGQSRSGDMVHASQTMASEEGFKNVSKLWYDKTISFDDGIAKMHEFAANREDLVRPANAVSFQLNDGGNLVAMIDGREYTPSAYALNQIAKWCNVSLQFVKDMTNPKMKQNGKVDFERDQQDRETFAAVINNGKRRIDGDKDFLFRTYKHDGTLRAMLTDRYSIIDNDWVMQVYKEIIPTGRLSHWKGDADTIYGNILIPDSIRQEDDSEYGGMLSIGNCEIGKRRLEQYPSIFRAICMNGCIWDQECGTEVSQVHRGNIDRNALRKLMIDNLNEQIPLMASHVDKLLNLRKFEIKSKEAGETPLQILAQIVEDNGLTYGTQTSQFARMVANYGEHEKQNRNLFGVVNALTRMGQEFDPETWYKCDLAAGSFLSFNEDKWSSYKKRALNMDPKKFEKFQTISA